MSGKLRVGVVGVGHLGRNHARIYSQMPNVELVGVVDSDPAHSQSVAKEFNTKSLSRLEGVDAVSIATPTVSHFEIASEFIKNGVHVLVEKPMTKTVAQAEQLTALARENKVILQVGHIERFNPVITAMEPHLNDLRFIEAHRLGTFTPRSLDVGVVMDLMIHDIDLILNFVKSDVRSVAAMGVSLATPLEDLANARITFENGCTANITASRISLKSMRQMRIFKNDLYISADFMNNKAELIRKSSDFNDRVSKLISRREYFVKSLEPKIKQAASEGKDALLDFFSGLINKESINIIPQEPLKAELEHFVECVNTGCQPKVTGEDGLKAIRIANRIIAEINSSLQADNEK